MRKRSEKYRNLHIGEVSIADMQHFLDSIHMRKQEIDVDCIFFANCCFALRGTNEGENYSNLPRESVFDPLSQEWESAIAKKLQKSSDFCFDDGSIAEAPSPSTS